MQIKTYLISFILLILIVIIFQNSEAVPIKVLFWEFKLSRIICLITSLLAGTAAGYILGSWKHKRKK